MIALEMATIPELSQLRQGTKDPSAKSAVMDFLIAAIFLHQTWALGSMLSPHLFVGRPNRIENGKKTVSFGAAQRSVC